MEGSEKNGLIIRVFLGGLGSILWAVARVRCGCGFVRLQGGFAWVVFGRLSWEDRVMVERLKCLVRVGWGKGRVTRDKRAGRAG